MPRELLHWAVLDAATADRADISSSPNSWKYLYLGAIVHDAPYYLNFGRSEEGTLVADSLHGTRGEDTYIVLRTLCGEIPKLNDPENKRAMLLVIVGMFSHILVDAIFHPLINFLSGNYYSDKIDLRQEARAKHRSLETVLDNLIMDSSFCPRSNWLSVKHFTPADLAQISIALSQATPLSLQLWQRSIRQILWMTSIFRNPAAARVAKSLEGWLPRYGEFTALFMKTRLSPRISLAERIDYQCPVTGDKRSHSIMDLYWQSVHLLREFVNEIPKDLTDCSQINKLSFFDRVGPSLDSGLLGSSASQLRFFKTYSHS